MNRIGYLLIAASLTLGVISSTTAYLPRLDFPDERLAGLTLNADAGRRVLPHARDGAVAPIAKHGQPITPEVLEQLRRAGVDRVRVKEFSMANWTHRGWFLISVAGLLGGAALVRARARKAPARAGGPAVDEMPPEQAVARIREIVGELRRQLPALPDDQARLSLILERLSEVQSHLVPAVASGRARLVGELGLRGYADFMVRFAAAERQVNRAWSAAADGVYAEATECLELADTLLRV
jgi:hypothetical protein